MGLGLCERFVGCLLGEAVGDAVGAPLEGLSSDLIVRSVGPVQAYVAQPPVEGLYYTDDTQMMIGVAETLLACGEIRQAELAAAFARNYEPARGYGQGARQILEAIAGGGDWDTLAENLFPGGSYGNGAAMRVAPVGLVFHGDLDRVAEQARLSALPTHRHPLGIEGAQLLALAVALVVRQEGTLDHGAFFDELCRRAQEEEYQWLLRTARQLTAEDSLSLLGSSLPAHRSVVTAITCFATAPESYERAVARAIALGDDTDTLAAMTGALSGAHLGIQGVPGHLLAKLEDGAKGRGYLERLARGLAGRDWDG